MGSVRQTPADVEERRLAAVAHLEKRGVPMPVFHFVEAGSQGGVKAAWAWGDTYISHAVRFNLTTPYVVTEAELDGAATHLKDWFAQRRLWDDAPKELRDGQEV